jgi:hypothetical protein
MGLDIGLARSAADCARTQTITTCHRVAPSRARSLTSRPLSHAWVLPHGKVTGELNSVVAPTTILQNSAMYLCGVIGLASEPFRGGSMQVPARRVRRRVGALTMRARQGTSRQRMSAFGLGALVSNITELFRSLEKPSLAGLPFFVGG